jgi:excisionase family DNA binding protein
MNIALTSEKICYTRMLNIIEAATLLGAHKETIRRMVASGELPGVKIGRAWRFIEQDLMDHIRSQYNSFTELSLNSHRRSTQQWPSQKEITSGGLISHTKEKDYAKVLGLM